MLIATWSQGRRAILVTFKQIDFLGGILLLPRLLPIVTVVYKFW